MTYCLLLGKNDIHVNEITDGVHQLSITEKEGKFLLSDCKDKYNVQFTLDERIRAIELTNIVDKKLESLDPNPDIQVLFKEYDKRFFNGILYKNGVEISWSQRMTSCAGCNLWRIL